MKKNKFFLKEFKKKKKKERKKERKKRIISYSFLSQQRCRNKIQQTCRSHCVSSATKEVFQDFLDWH